MGNVLVLYESQTGNTKKMAELVVEGAGEIPDIEVRLLSVEEAMVEDFRWCQGIAVGSPTNFGSISWRMKKWWDELPPENWGKEDGKIGCAFSSSGAWGGGNELTCLAILIILMDYGLLTFGVPDYVAKQFAPHYGSVVAGEPRDDRDKDSCRRLGRRLSEWVASLHEGRADQHPIEQGYPRFEHLG